MRSPFSCFGSHGYDATLTRHSEPNRQLRYSTAALPPLQATSHPSRRPVPVRKESISSPTDFEHVSHSILPQAKEREKENMTDEPIPTTLERVRSLVNRSPLASSRARAQSASAFKPSAFDNDENDGYGYTSPAVERPFSVSGPREPRSSTSLQKRASLPPQMAFVRAHLESTTSSDSPAIGLSPVAPLRVKRKVPPAVTMSVIRSAGGTDAVARTGPVPSRLLLMATSNGAGSGPEPAQDSATASKLLLRELFSPSELEALSAASNGERASAIQAKLGEHVEDADGSALYDTETTKAFKGALKEIEDALRREISEGSYGPI